MSRQADRCALVDLALAGVVAAIELADMYLSNPSGRHDPLDVTLLVITAAVLLARRRLPLPTALIAAAATTVLAARHAPHIGLGAIAATYAVAAFGSRNDRLAAAVLLLVGVWLVPLLTADSDSIPRNVALFGAAWTLGHLMRERREQHLQLLAQANALQRERQEKLALAAAAERQRLAQEVHDVLTHSVSVMVIQAQGAQTIQETPARVRSVLERIEHIGRDALAGLRILLRDSEDDTPPLTPQPDLERIGELARATRESGIDVHLEMEIPDPPLPATLQLSAYRIVQEALTNVLRHSQATEAAVAVRCHTHTLEIEVVDDGHGATRGSHAGRGIVGMRQRAIATGGSLDADSIDGGGFRVLAHLPMPR